MLHLSGIVTQLMVTSSFKDFFVLEIASGPLLLLIFGRPIIHEFLNSSFRHTFELCCSLAIVTILYLFTMNKTLSLISFKPVP